MGEQQAHRSGTKEMVTAPSLKGVQAFGQYSQTHGVTLGDVPGQNRS